ncbi:MAG: (Fe-S)-binding protein [Nitrospirae bacterium]|nr:(Fe-S)-binding protein [Nitrospirota bacterium]
MGIKKKIKGYESCSGCGVCLLVCPLWRSTGSMAYTRKGRAKAMQGGVAPEDIASSIDACFMCGSCEPACPEGIDIVGMNLEQRRRLNESRSSYPAWYPKNEIHTSSRNSKLPQTNTILMAGRNLDGDIKIVENIVSLLGGDKSIAISDDDGRDIAAAVEAGLPVPPERIALFISLLRNAKNLIVSEGILHRQLREWLPAKKVMGIGEALLNIQSIRKALGPDDIFIVESRGYHSDFERLVKFYDRLRKDTGCLMNLDLQRIAIPTGASSLRGAHNRKTAGCSEHSAWILKGRKFKRIVVEDLSDIEVFQEITDVPVVHLSMIVK